MSTPYYALIILLFMMLNIFFSYLEGSEPNTVSLINVQLFREFSLPPPLNFIQFPIPSGNFFVTLFNAMLWNFAMFESDPWMQLVKIPFWVLSGGTVWGVWKIMGPMLLNAVGLLRRLSPL